MQGKEIFAYFSASRQVLRPTQPHIQWIVGGFCRRYNGRIVKLTTDLHPVPKSRMVELYLRCPTLLHDVVLN
jgi:hypothetical protein